jgi:hypothetical protein
VIRGSGCCRRCLRLWSACARGVNHTKAGAKRRCWRGLLHGCSLEKRRVVSILLSPAACILIDVCPGRLGLVFSGLYRVISFRIALYRALSCHAGLYLVLQRVVSP